MSTPEFDEFHFIRKYSPEANAWVEEFRRAVPQERSTRALRLLQSAQFAPGLRELRSYRKSISSSNAIGSVKLAGLRWYHSVLAYYFYCTARYLRASEEMDLAEQTVRRAVELCPFLLPMLTICEECLIQKARIERKQNHWMAMKRHLGAAELMDIGQAPLCYLNQRPVMQDDIHAYFLNLPSLNDMEFASSTLRMVLDGDYRRKKISATLASVYLVPGFVIPYGLGPVQA
ncbi:MAG: hypothetical protein LAO76_01420 [Acidobacteriia bacterium]|nr:hypothetical protein [Terriglobia bacterium]